MKKIINQFRILKKKLLFCLVFLMGTSTLLAQDVSTRTLTGNVTDETGSPVTGATVKVNGTNLATTVDLEGNYQIQVDSGQVILSFSFIGYETQEKIVGGNEQVVNAVLTQSADLLDEVVVIGYGTMKRSDVTGSIGHVGQEVISTKVATSVVDYLKGSVAGVNISVDNGASGGGNIEVRGPASLTASSSPLIVLDGNIYYGNLDDINPNDIESMDVLKDASSTAIYGAKGSAGVIMINTKRGTTDEPVISVNAESGLASLISIPALPTPEQYIQRRSDYWETINYFRPPATQRGISYYDNPDNLPEGVTRDQWAAYDPSFSGDYAETWLNRLQFTNVEIQNYKLGRTVDWRDHVFHTGFRQDYSASVSGRSSKLNYYASLGYTDNEGFQVGDTFQATRGRINLDSEITNWLTIGANTQFSNRGNTSVAANQGGADTMSPYGSMYEEDGSLKAHPTDDARVANPLLANQYDQKFHQTQTLISTIYGKLTLPYGITFQTNYNNRFGWRKEYYYQPDINPGIIPGGSASRNEFSDYEWLIDNILKWNYTIADIHNFDVTLVASAEKYRFYNTIADNEGFIPNGNLGFHNLEAGINPFTESNDEMQTGKSILGRLNYTLLNRYILTSSVRRDGFSAFGINNPYGVYPAFAFAWRISEENFMENSAFDNLKLRLSWGETGNRDIGRYVALSRLNVTDNIIGGENVKGVWTNNLANQNLKWERTRANNIGLDFSILRNRLNVTFDAYSNKTTDLILTRALPRITGYADVIANLGQVDNKGMELTLNSVNLDRPNVRWSSTFIYSTNKNTIRHLYGDMGDVKDAEGNVIGQREADDIQNGWYIGHGIHDIFYHRMIGIWQLGEEAEAAKYGKQPGDPRLLDLNADGRITNEDKEWLGSRTPRYRMSLRNDLNLFDRINFSFVIRGEFNYLGEDNLARNEDNRFFDRSNSIMTEYWTPENPSNEYARLGSNSSNPSVLIFKKRDFVRLQNAALSYTFPEAMLSKFSIRNLQVSLNVDNAFVITNWSYFDPETMGRVPRIFTLGINATL